MDLKEKYYTKSREIEQKLSKMKVIIKKHKLHFEKNSTNWGYLGDLINLENKLDEMINFTGM